MAPKILAITDKEACHKQTIALYLFQCFPIQAADAAAKKPLDDKTAAFKQALLENPESDKTKLMKQFFNGGHVNINEGPWAPNLLMFYNKKTRAP